VKARPTDDRAVRDRAAEDFDTTFLLEASAGTGKTTVLVNRILGLLASGRTTVDRLVAITFTEKAAGELKLRVREELEGAVPGARGPERERLVRAAADLERAPISTIHAFCSALLKERPFEAGLDPGFAVSADVAGDRTFEETWDRWLDEHLSDGDPVLVRALHLGLKLDQLHTAALRMVAERDLLGRSVPAPPFNPTGLVSEMLATAGRLGRMRSACLDADDGAFKAILALEADAARCARLSGPELESALLGIRVTAHLGSQTKWNPKSACVDVKAELKAMKVRLAGFEAELLAEVAWSLRDRLRTFIAAHGRAKDDKARVDFQDLLLRARDTLAQSLPVRRYFQDRFDHILVDEFQDTDPLQAEIAFLLAEDPTAPPATDWRDVRLRPGKLFVVGDPKQSIYRFRRADLGMYQAVKALIVDGGGEVLELTRNFRTVPSVVAFVNEQFGEIFREPEDPSPLALVPSRDEPEGGGARTVLLPIPRERLPIENTVGALRPVLAKLVAALVQEAVGGRGGSPWTVVDRRTGMPRPARPGDIALLLRKMTPALVGPFEDELRRRGLRYRLVGGKEYYARDEVRALGAVLRAIDNPADRYALVMALRSPFFALSDDELFGFVATGGTLHFLAPVPEAARGADLFRAVFERLTRLHRLRRVAPPSEVIESLFSSTRSLPGFLLRPSGEQRLANLWKILNVARSYEAAGPATLRGLVRFLEGEAQSGREEGDSPVGEEAGAALQILTVHKAKGLEYPIVVVADLLSDRFPGADAILDHAAGEGWLKIGSFKPAGWAEREEWETRQREAEERRLLYVALTRARDHLVLPCFTGERRPGWLDDVLAGVVVPGVEPPLSQRTPTLGGAATVTWWATHELSLDVAAAPGSSLLGTVGGADGDTGFAAQAEDAWVARRAADRARARAAPRTTFSLGQAARSDPDASPSELAAELARTLVLAPLEAVRPAALTHAASRGVADAEAAGLADTVARMLGLPHVAAARRADRVLRAIPWKLGAETGIIDVAYSAGGQWTIIQFDAGDDPAAAGVEARRAKQAFDALAGASAHAYVCGPGGVERNA
jgi:ATP-dependent helicase/nuclease subunit A